MRARARKISAEERRVLLAMMAGATVSREDRFPWPPKFRVHGAPKNVRGEELTEVDELVMNRLCSHGLLRPIEPPTSPIQSVLQYVRTEKAGDVMVNNGVLLEAEDFPDLFLA